jgi:hypothetical protein
LGPRTVSCPLCGAEAGARPGERPAGGVQSYQADVRKLREQLRKLRDGAGAV